MVDGKTSLRSLESISQSRNEIVHYFLNFMLLRVTTGVMSLSRSTDCGLEHHGSRVTVSSQHLKRFEPEGCSRELFLDNLRQGCFCMGQM